MNNVPFEQDRTTLARLAWERAEARRAELQALRIAVAERVCGYAPCEEGVWLTPEHIQNGDPYEAFTVLDELPQYSTDRNACAEAEARMIELGHGENYANALHADLCRGHHTQAGCLPFLTASAETRCRAMLDALPVRA